MGLTLNFNPRSYKRSDQFSTPVSQYSKISIHAPTRGATISRYRIMAKLKLFQSTLLQEERRERYALPKYPRSFQSTLLQEERHYSAFHFLSSFKFQSTLLQEERRCSSCVPQLYPLFQSTLLQEERLETRQQLLQL